MENTNSYRDIDMADRLWEIKSELLQKKSGNTAQKKVQPIGSFELPESFEVISVADINEDQLAVHEEAEVLDSASITSYSSFSFCKSDGTGGVGAQWSYNAFVDSTGDWA